MDQYQLDLAIIEDERRLDIEVDGERYHRDWTGELSRKDQIRNQRMFELGWDVMRFWVYEVRDYFIDSKINLNGTVSFVKKGPKTKTGKAIHLIRLKFINNALVSWTPISPMLTIF